MQRWLIVLGFVLVALGALWPVLSRIGIGRLPGDITIHRPGMTFYFPIATSLILSVILSIIVWILRR